MNDVEIAYLAGLIDGEGCISIMKAKPPVRCKSPRYRLQLCITNTNSSMMAWLSKRGFCIYRLKVKKGHPTICYRATITDRKAANVLKRSLSYLTAKYEEALIGMALQEHKDCLGNIRGLTKEHLAYRESLKQRLHALKAGSSLSMEP